MLGPPDHLVASARPHLTRCRQSPAVSEAEPAGIAAVGAVGVASGDDVPDPLGRVCGERVVAGPPLNVVGWQQARRCHQVVVYGVGDGNGVEADNARRRNVLVVDVTLVGADNRVTLCHLGVFVDESAESSRRRMRTSSLGGFGSAGALGGRCCRARCGLCVL